MPLQKPVYKRGSIAYHRFHMAEISKEITICPMHGSDIEQIMAIERASFPLPWLAQHFLDEINSAAAFPLTAFDHDGRVVGYICPMQVLDEGHILNVAVDPDCRGLGVGRSLVQRVLDDFCASGAAFVSLEVRVSNGAAISLYRQMGFAEVGRRKRYYENGEDALMMEYLC
ncbi:MAG: Acetyltransferase, family [Deltaproteobacteria bacterium]|nr:Acetyltransferase, family [Deltaproteobacteria bacterium]